MTTREELIHAKLQATFSPLDCQIENESALHAGHAGAASGGGHYRLRLVSAAFEGQNRITRHRLVYDCLNDMMQSDIHALAIIALAPSEVSS
ncbi:MAG: BolA family protein [Burkholderiaceae bacterium]